MSAEKPRTKVNAFHRDAGGFLDPKKEAFAQEWAKTGLLVRACEAADVVTSTGQKWRGTAEMVTRIRELRAGAQTFVGVSKASIVNQLNENMLNAAAAGKFKESNDAAEQLYTIMSKDPDMKGGENEASAGVSADMTAEELEAHRKKVFQIHVLPSNASDPRQVPMFEPEQEEPVFGGVDEL